MNNSEPLIVPAFGNTERTLVSHDHCKCSVSPKVSKAWVADECKRRGFELDLSDFAQDDDFVTLEDVEIEFGLAFNPSDFIGVVHYNIDTAEFLTGAVEVYAVEFNDLTTESRLVCLQIPADALDPDNFREVMESAAENELRDYADSVERDDPRDYF